MGKLTRCCHHEALVTKTKSCWWNDNILLTIQVLTYTEHSCCDQCLRWAVYRHANISCVSVFLYVSKKDFCVYQRLFVCVSQRKASVSVVTYVSLITALIPSSLTTCCPGNHCHRNHHRQQQWRQSHRRCQVELSCDDCKKLNKWFEANENKPPS